MRRTFHRPLASEDDLRWLEGKLVRSRARFSMLVKGWLIVAALMIVVGVLADDPGAPFVPLIMILGTGIWVVRRAARVSGAHPRLLAAQRELLRQRDPESEARSDAALHVAIRQALAGLGRRIEASDPPRPDLAAALEHAVGEVDGIRDALDRALVRQALRDTRPVAEASAAAGREPHGAPIRARLEAFRLALANCEIAALLDPRHLERRGTDEIEAARLLLREEPSGTGEVPPAPEADPEERRNVDSEAHHLYLKGRFFWNKRTRVDLEKSLGCFRQALARGADDALVHAGIADVYNVFGYYGFREPAESFPRAREAARRALVLAPDLAEAHCSLAFSKLLYDWDWPGAEAGFKRSFELDPGYATAHHWYAEYLSFRERHDEAIVEARRAVELDPLSRILRTILAWALFYARRYGEAIVELEEALALEPRFAPAELWLGLAYEQTGDRERGLEILERANADGGHNPMARAALGRLYHALGKDEASREVLTELLTDARTRYVPAYHLATLYSGRGEQEKCFGALDQALAARDNWLVFLKIDPVWDALRSDPRFETLLRAVGLAS